MFTEITFKHCSPFLVEDLIKFFGSLEPEKIVYVYRDHSSFSKFYFTEEAIPEEKLICKKCLFSDEFIDHGTAKELKERVEKVGNYKRWYRK